MPKAKEANVYDLVERAAARRKVPRLELWEKVLRALIENKLRPLNLSISDHPNPIAAPCRTYRGCFDDILRSIVDRRFDPPAYIFREIIVRCSHFESLLRKGNIGGRGPRPNETGFQKADRKLFPKITGLKKTGEARSAHGAALKLAGEIAGSGSDESKAKRVSALYRKEHTEDR